MALPPGSLLDLDWAGSEILGIDDCWRLVDTQAVGRIGLVDAGSPVILPVNIARDGSRIVFRTGPGSKLAAAMLQRPVCVEVDHWDPMQHTGWSVVAKGVADHVLDPDELDRLDRLPVRPWSNPDRRPEWVRVMVTELTGRRLRHGELGHPTAEG